MLLKGYYREQKQIITSYIGSPVFCLESMLIGVVYYIGHICFYVHVVMANCWWSVQ